MSFKAKNNERNTNSCALQISVSPTPYQQWRDVMLVSMCFLLTLLASEVKGQTSASTPPSASATVVPQTTAPPDAEAAPQSNAAATQEQQPDGQQPGDDQSSGFVFKKQVREVILHATVVDEQRRLVTDLDRPAFTAFENGVPQATTSFHREDVPVAMGIVIDNSGSMREKRDKVNQAVLNLIRASGPNDETFVVNFSQDSFLDQDFTSDSGLLQEALQKVSAQGSTALYDAIVASAVHLKNNTRIERKVLLVITDGRDNASQETLQEAARRLQQENGPTLYAIGLLGDELQRSDTGALQSLAEVTGGVAFFPKGLDEVEDITRVVARDIHSQYTIGYKPTDHSTNGGYRTIEVRAQAPGHRKLTVRTRSGYYAGEAVH
ncbi:MAG: VWA domain-containing protein [Candidatus Sulfotelmatobacter sp.]|jgi:VWFA-related protein